MLNCKERAVTIRKMAEAESFVRRAPPSGNFSRGFLYRGGKKVRDAFVVGQRLCHIPTW